MHIISVNLNTSKESREEISLTSNTLFHAYPELATNGYKDNTNFMSPYDHLH